MRKACLIVEIREIIKLFHSLTA